MDKTIDTRLVEGRQARLDLQRAELRVVAGPDRGLMRELSAESLLIGSAPACDLVLSDPTVSARHAEIVATELGYLIRDLGSTNGIVSANIALLRARLMDNMRLDLGDSALVVRALKGTHSVPLSPMGRSGQLVAHSVKMRALVAQLEQLAAGDTTVLIEGETGVGKERVAASLHEMSARKKGPFVVFDCGAVSRELVAAELFGHSRGAFTGADVSRAGLFAEADGGTLFLDEIGELALELQPMLLRAVAEKTVRAIGSPREARYDVRLVAASNRKLATEVAAGRFRADLYHRLAVGRVHVPPLRERREDIAGLSGAFASELGIIIPPEVLATWIGHEWPGNVRELRNAVLSLSARRVSESERPKGAEQGWLDEAGRLLPLPEARRVSGELLERRYLEVVLDAAAGSLTRAAELAGITRQSLTNLALKHGLHPRGRR